MLKLSASSVGVAHVCQAKRWGLSELSQSMREAGSSGRSSVMKLGPFMLDNPDSRSKEFKNTKHKFTDWENEGVWVKSKFPLCS